MLALPWTRCVPLGTLLSLSENQLLSIGGKKVKNHLPGLPGLPNELMTGESFVNHELCRCVGMFQGAGITGLGPRPEWAEPLVCIQMCMCV